MNSPRVTVWPGMESWGIPVFPGWAEEEAVERGVDFSSQSACSGRGSWRVQTSWGGLLGPGLARHLHSPACIGGAVCCVSEPLGGVSCLRKNHRESLR